jgi:predicted esterase
MILATMFYYPELIKNAALLHAMLPFNPKDDLDLKDHNILMSWSKNDPIITETASRELIETLKRHSAKLKIIESTGGHSITRGSTILTKFLI